MKDDYLWDGSGEPDPDVQRLETLLRPLRHEGKVPAFPEIPLAAAKSRPYERLWLPGFSKLALGAAAAIVMVVILTVHRGDQKVKTFYEVVSLTGSPCVNAARIQDTGRLRIGQWLETDGSSRARIRVGEIGQVEVEPNTRIKLEQAQATEHRLRLAHGILHVVILAPPRVFSVDTPSARAVDLGCAYILEVDDDGRGLLRVTAGWVAFESGGRESFVPAGAMCMTRPGAGPGTPHQEDSSRNFNAALEQLDFNSGGPQEARDSLAVVLSEARKQDAFSLWHLLSRRNETERTLIYERLAQLVPPPAGVTREGILSGSRNMLDLWWDQLGLGDTQFWRRWEQAYPVQK